MTMPRYEIHGTALAIKKAVPGIYRTAYLRLEFEPRRPSFFQMISICA
jgi:hypothetical protein